jgi:hypothetical protein
MLPPVSSWEEIGREIAEHLAASISLDRAAAVRRLRVDEHHTWRGVSHEFYELFPDAPYAELAGDQIPGMYLCEAAARLLGEDPNAAPWN